MLFFSEKGGRGREVGVVGKRKGDREREGGRDQDVIYNILRQ